MTTLLNYIVWNPDVYLIQVGHWGLRWYSACWLLGLLGAYFMVKWLFYHQHIAEKTVFVGGKKQVVNVFDPLFIYCFLGILIGARLGHCLFYQPDYFLSSGTHFIEMLIPYHKMPDGSWQFVGYEGLASHGGTLGLMIALWLYCRKTGVKLWQVLDDIALATPITACFIRLGNLMNSEIIGKISGVGKMATTVGASSIIGTNVAGDTVYTASGESAVSIYAGGTGVGNSIGGITFSITDTQGNINKSANAVLDAFSETVRAQDNSQDNSMNFQIGTRANQAIRVGMTDMRAQALGLQGSDGSTLNISTRDKANAAINVLDNAIAKALDQQTTIGAVQSRLNYTSQNLTTASENVQASESTIRDADMAKAMTNYTKNNVLMQAAQAMLAQANQSSSGVLSLLQ